MSNHTDLNVLLEKIEKRAKLPVSSWANFDVLRLVKALRRALELSDCTTRPHAARAELTAILQASSEPSGTDSSSATSVSSPNSSPSPVTGIEEEKWTVAQSPNFRNRCEIVTHQSTVVGSGLWPEIADKIACEHNASLERHGKRVKQKMLDEAGGRA